MTWITPNDHAAVRWQVVCDPADPSHALAVNDDGTLRFLLEEKYVQPMALAERTDGDAAQLKRVMDFNRALEDDIEEQLDRMHRNNEALFAHNSQLDNTLGKHLLIDSRGQHKDQYNRRRLKSSTVDTDTEDEEIVPVAVPRKKEDEGKGKRFDIY